MQLSKGPRRPAPIPEYFFGGGLEGESLNRSESTWGVILLGHGSQRGASPRECSCAWQQPTESPSGDANVNGNSVADLPGWPAWCRRCPSTPQGLGEVAQRLQSELGNEKAQVLLSCLEFIQPFPDEAVKLLSQQGMNQVVMLPYLLGNGKHATVEMDEMLDEVRAQYPQVELVLAEGLGADPRLASLIVDRIGDMDHAAPEPKMTTASGWRSWARWWKREWGRGMPSTWHSPTTAIRLWNLLLDG